MTMARSDNTSIRLTPVDKWERRAARRPRPVERRRSTKRQVILAALAQEA